MANNRASGILLHPTSFPGPYGIGELGSFAYQFIDFLVNAEQQYWQICPLNPTGFGDSPYQSFSAFAGNPYLISIEQLLKEGLLKDEDLVNMPQFPPDKVDYGRVIPFKIGLLKMAYNRWRERCKEEPEEF